MTVSQKNIRSWQKPSYENYTEEKREHPELAERFRERRHLLDEHLKEKRPEVYELVIQLRKKISDEQREQEEQ